MNNVRTFNNGEASLTGGKRLLGDSITTRAGPLVSIVTVVFNRADPLATTIESVKSQTYANIEHIIIDGGSSDSTLDTIHRYEEAITFWQSERDNGIYDAINKGIAHCKGEYIMLLHAADTYEPDYVARLVKVAANNPGAIIYSGHRHGSSAVDASDMNEGIFLHHLGINHLTFLVPSTVYAKLGVYNTNLRIMSDVLWMGKAKLDGVEFIRVDGHGLNFAEGGLSSAASPAHRELVIAEAVTFYRSFFPFLPEDIASAIYLYRFKEEGIDRILSYLKTILAASERTDKVEFFLRSLSCALRHIWASRSINVLATPFFFNARWDVANLLDISLDRANLRNGDAELKSIVQSINSLKERVAGRSITVHYLEVFSRPSETFIPDLINRLRKNSDDEHVILCDRRELAGERAYPHIFVFNYTKYHVDFARRVTEFFIDALRPSGLIFHFATNGWRFFSRINVSYRQLPAIFMTHGVDVFDLAKPSPCTDFILKVAAKLPQVRFTAVSSYLRNALVETGIPFHKVTLVHNVAHDRFAGHRRTGASKARELQQSTYAARLVNIGRIVRWKGQADIIRAMGILRREGVHLHLTLIYGQEAADLDNLREIVASEGVTDRVTLRPFVDFESEPNFFSDFDILVSASKYTEGLGARSETFGMSILEAIAAGLPVVVTDAGGQPEVAGTPSQYVRIAKHDNPASLAAEIRTLLENGALLGDNSLVADERLSCFSTSSQMALLAAVTAETRSHRIRALLFSTALNQGAGGAAQGVHRSLLAAGTQSRLIFRHLLEGWPLIPAVEPAAGVVHVSDNSHPTGWFLRKGHTIFSVDTDGIPSSTLEKLVEDVDIINLHWYARFLSNENIAWLTNLGKPVVFTIRDMHPLTGGCHFFHGCDNWKHSCFPCPQFRPENIPVPNAEFERKRLGWNFDNISVITLSDHTKRIVEQSPLFGGCRIETIPNPVDTTIFRPLAKDIARDLLGLPHDRMIIAYLPSFDSKIKGATEFEQMLWRLNRISSENFVVVCAGRRNVQIDSPFEVVQIGHISERDRLAAFFSAADITVTPSLEETFSNTVAESIACGTPVAGFATGAIPSLAREARGMAVAVGDVDALAHAVLDILKRSRDNDPLELHSYIVDHHSPEDIGAAYNRFFSELIDSRVQRGDPPAVQQHRSSLSHYLATRLAYAERSTSRAVVEGSLSMDGPHKTNKTKTVANKHGQTWPPESLGDAFVELRPKFKKTEGVLVHEDRILIPANSRAGHKLYGPNVFVQAGVYRIGVEMSVDLRERIKRKFPMGLCYIEVVWNVDDVLATKDFKLRKFSSGEFSWAADFEVTEAQAESFKEGLEVRMWTDGLVPWRLMKTTILECN